MEERKRNGGGGGGGETDKSEREREGGSREVKGECGRERGSEKMQQIIMW